MTICLIVEGENALTAVQELLNYSNIAGRLQIEQLKKSDTLSIVATIVSVAGGSIGIAEQIHKWYEKWCQRNQESRFEVVIKSDEKRIYLGDATLKDIKDLLENL